jgi:NAD-dependent deacetylase
MVHPVAGLVPRAVDYGAKLVIVNAEPTPFDTDADALVRGDITEVLGPLLGVATTQ